MVGREEAAPALGGAVGQVCGRYHGNSAGHSGDGGLRGQRVVRRKEGVQRRRGQRAASRGRRGGGVALLVLPLLLELGPVLCDGKEKQPLN